MASDQNAVHISGRLVRDPELRTTAGGLTVASMRIASNTSRKNKATGEWEDSAGFYNVNVFDKQAENVAKFLTKGQKITVDGRLNHRTWESNSGERREAVEIVAQQVHFPPKSESDAPKQDAAQAPGEDVPF